MFFVHHCTQHWLTVSLLCSGCCQVEGKEANVIQTGIAWSENLRLAHGGDGQKRHWTEFEVAFLRFRENDEPNQARGIDCRFVSFASAIGGVVHASESCSGSGELAYDCIGTLVGGTVGLVDSFESS